MQEECRGRRRLSGCAVSKRLSIYHDLWYGSPGTSLPPTIVRKIVTLDSTRKGKTI
jgi:hypothetical protein